jgi:hypothetical protein
MPENEDPTTDEKPETKATPPWGSDDDFKPEKAWSLIQALRADKEKLTGERDSFKQKVESAEAASLSDLEKAQRERDAAVEASNKSAGDAARLRAAVKFGIDEDDLDLLGNGTEDEILARAERLASRFKADPVPGKPRESMPRGGGDPDAEPEETDPAKLAAAVPRSVF